MTKVAFDKYDFLLREQEGVRFIFDEVRQKWIQLTPEEWVRQHILHYLIYNKGVSKNLIAVERGIQVNGKMKRFDVVVFNKEGKPSLIVECKATEEKINQDVLLQIGSYNLNLNANFFWLTNGEQNYFMRLDGFEVLKEIPEFI